MSYFVKKRLDIYNGGEKDCMANRGCPAIMVDMNNNIIIIGKDITDQIDNLEQFNASISVNEKAVLIPKEIWLKANEKY